MSWEAAAIAMRHTRARTATTKLVLLGIANHDGDGGSWPSVATLAEYALCSTRQVQRAVDELERLGEVRRIIRAGGPRHMADHARPNLYEFLLRCPPDCDRTKNHRTRRRTGPAVELAGLDGPLLDPVDNSGGGDTHVTTPGDTHVTRTSPPEPTTNDGPRSQPPARAREVTHSSWDHGCVDGQMASHRLSRKTGACAYCGARRVSWTEQEA